MVSNPTLAGQTQQGSGSFDSVRDVLKAPFELAVQTQQGRPSFLGRARDILSIAFVFNLTSLYFCKHFLTTLLTNPLTLSIPALRCRAFTSFLTLLPLTILPDSPQYGFLAVQKEARGTVLDLGPGTGINIEHFDKENVDAIYAAEPSFTMHPQLYEQVKKQGMEGKYKVMECGGEHATLIPALEKEDLITHGDIAIFDAIYSCNACVLFQTRRRPSRVLSSC